MYPLIVTGQEDQCPKFKIGVSLGEIYARDTTVNYLNEKHHKNFTANEWINEIESTIFKELNSAGYDELEFFSPKSNPSEDMDFRFTFNLGPWSVDKDEIIPAYEVRYIDPVTGWEVTEYRSPRYNLETAFRMTTTLANCSTCLPLMSYILSIQIAVDTDIYQLIKNLIHHYNWPLDKNISDWEAKHPAPAREPQMEVRYEKEDLSLLDEESRKMEVYIKVKNCHGEYVYDKFHSQPVYFLKEMDRLEFKNTMKCIDGPDWGLFSTIYTNKDYEAVGQYLIKKGFEASLEKPRFKTCGIGDGSLIELEGEIKVLGLELEVEPDRRVIYNGEQTSIQIDLHELDPDGTEILSCYGKEVDVKVTGLVDGKVSHESGMITLNEAGVAFIEYKAGQKDRQIKIDATFTPPKYPEELKAEATITVKPLDYEATLTIKGSYTKDESDSYEKIYKDGIERGNYTMRERQEASFYVPLKLESSGDMAILNQRWEYYRPLNIILTSFSASYKMTGYEYSNSSSGFGHESTTIRVRNPLNRQIPDKEYLLQSNIILIIDKETDKVVKIATGGFPVEFRWDETEKTTGRGWNPDGSRPINESSHETDDMFTTFDASPVEDPVPDPTFTGISSSLREYLKDLGTPLPVNIDIPEDKEEIPEIEPDLLVKFGDGTTFFGGEGKKVIDDSKGSSKRKKEMTFNWQVTRKKKP